MKIRPAIWALVLGLLAGSVSASAASAATSDWDLTDPVGLMDAIAADQVTPTSPEVVATPVPSRPTGAEPELARVEVVADAMGRSTSVELPPEVESSDVVADYLVYTSEDEEFATYVKPTPGGAQVIYATSDRTYLDDFEVTLPLAADATLQPAMQNGFYVYLEDSTAIYLRAPWARDASGRELDSHYELEGNLIRQVVDAPNDVVFPVVADPAWDYTFDYGIGSRTPASVQATLHSCFNCKFPVPGAPAAFPDYGDYLPLYIEAWPGWPATQVNFNCVMRYEEYRDYPPDWGGPAYGWWFDAAASHIDGAGSTISFDTFRKDGESTYTLRVYGYVVNTNPGGIPQAAYITGAFTTWALFQQNLYL